MQKKVMFYNWLPKFSDNINSFAIIFILAIGLFIDQKIEFWGQSIANTLMWLLFLILLKNGTHNERISLIVCVLYATMGEIFFSLIWGLYEYRLHNIPLFVPPGHGLLFTLGILLAPKIPIWSIWIVPGITTPYMIFALMSGVDTMGGILFLTFLICLIFGKAKKLYATMFIFSLILELYGTWLGNWTWHYEVPWLGLTSTNPPACAGAFYCLLDLMVVSTVGQLQIYPKTLQVTPLEEAR